MLPGGGAGDDPDRHDWWWAPLWEFDEYYICHLYHPWGELEEDQEPEHLPGDDPDPPEEPSLKRSRLK